VDLHWFQRDPDPVSQINARIHPDPDPGQTLKSHKVEFLHEKYNVLNVDKDWSKNIPYRRIYGGTKTFFGR
jgi:hypothetical protein